MDREDRADELRTENSFVSTRILILAFAFAIFFKGFASNVAYSAPSEYDTAWVELRYDGGRLYANSSAIDYDGGVLVVGAVPEPFSGTLALLGVGVLALRRKMKKAKKA